jgi:hypothetical protein
MNDIYDNFNIATQDMGRGNKYIEMIEYMLIYFKVHNYFTKTFIYQEIYSLVSYFNNFFLF